MEARFHLRLKNYYKKDLKKIVSHIEVYKAEILSNKVTTFILFLVYHFVKVCNLFVLLSFVSVFILNIYI